MKGDIFHVFNRGVEKRKVFIDNQDYLRFVDNLFLLNNKSGKIRTSKKDFWSQNLQRDKLVEILKWSLLSNHYHLVLYEINEGGVLEFTKRLGNAYTKYFNTKNSGRSGYLFQNSAKIVPVINDPQLNYLPFYVDLNPLELKFTGWKENKIDSEKALEFLKNYRWSSFYEYYSNGNRSKIINEELFFELFDTDLKLYEKDMLNYLKNPDELVIY